MKFKHAHLQRHTRSRLHTGPRRQRYGSSRFGIEIKCNITPQLQTKDATQHYLAVSKDDQQPKRTLNNTTTDATYPQHCCAQSKRGKSASCSPHLACALTILGPPRLRVHVLVVINISAAAIVVAPRPILQIAQRRMRYSPTRTEPQKPAAQGQDRRGGAARFMASATAVASGTKPRSQPRRGKNIAGAGPLAHMPPLVYLCAIQGG